MSSASSDQKDTDNAAATTYGSNASSSYGSASGDTSNYLSNVNSALSEGNPYQTTEYKTNQNLETSGAMDSANTAAQQKEQSTVAKTGTNSAALANTVSENARSGQRQMTDYNATRDTQNENSWQNEKQNLLGDEAKGAEIESGLYSTSVNGQDSALSSATSAANAEQSSTDSLFGSAIGAAGTVGGGYFTRR